MQNCANYIEFKMIRKLFLFIGIIALFSCNGKTDTKKFHTNLSVDWKITSSKNLEESGDKISKVGFDDNSWYSIDLPSTVLNSLVKNGVYKDIYFGNNLEKIPADQFKVPWWYRKTFYSKNTKNQNTHLVFYGINYRGNIWLNGNLIASADDIESPFRQFDIDISNYIIDGENTLAVEIIPPKRDDLTIGFVDWNPRAPDNNMGIWREVYLETSKGVSIKNTFVQTDVNEETLAEAFLDISTEVTNHFSEESKVKLLMEIDGVTISKEITLSSKETRIVKFNSKEFEDLHFKNPKLWWPNNLGKPELYNCKILCLVNEELSDEENARFGIREIEQYVNSEGHKGFKVNGKKVLIKGGGWVDDLMLADTKEKVEAQIQYAKHMNLNTIRLEGFWGNDKTIYEKADEYGVLLMIGWSCHWEWEGYCGRPETEYMCITTPEDMELQAKGYRDQVVWLRNHPSIFLWVYGSDKLPHPDLERKLNKYMEGVDTTRPILACCRSRDFDIEHSNVSEVSGSIGVKMLGPYGYVTPNYWYLDKNIGGAYGFNTETGPGPQVPPIESIKKMLPEENYWPIDEMWEFHLGRNEFQTLDRYLKAFNARYGEASSLEDFAFRSQISNYEAIRGMFEAFAVNKYNSTGIIQWMYNSAWPEMFWQLFDWYLMPNGAFYGTKVACQPLSLIYNYADNNIYVSNEFNKASKNLRAEITILDINSKVLLSKEVSFDIDATSSKMIFKIPKITDLSSTYFLDLKLKSQGVEESRNFYWLSTKKDVPDFKNSEWYVTPYKDFADFTALNKLTQAKVNVISKFEESENDQMLNVVIENVSDKIAFFIEFRVFCEETGETILPVFWSDNYISLLPGERRSLSAKFKVKDLNGNTPAFEYKGMNIN